jgi:hypothetical protein
MTVNCEDHKITITLKAWTTVCVVSNRVHNNSGKATMVKGSLSLGPTRKMPAIIWELDELTRLHYGFFSDKIAICIVDII